MLFILFSVIVFSQDKNKIIKDQYSEPMLIGYCTREAFNDSSFAIWFHSAYEDYNPDSSALELLKEKMDDIDITVVLGSWCDDSRIHIPHLYKILDEINYPAEVMTLIAVDEDKKTEADEIEGLEISFVPTVIFFKNDSELGRIVEMPNQTLEEDMLGIISETNR